MTTTNSISASSLSGIPLIANQTDSGIIADFRQSGTSRVSVGNAGTLNVRMDSTSLTIDAENLWINLNFHLMHFVDFMPAANWAAHRADPLLQMFQRLSALLDRAGQRRANVEVRFPESKAAPVAEERTLFGRVTGLLPPSITLKLARKSIREYSAAAGHDLSYRIDWEAG